MKCNRKIFKLFESVKWGWELAGCVTMRRKGHNGTSEISFLVGHFGEPRRKLRATTKRFQNCFQNCCTMSKYGVVCSVRSWSANKRIGICSNANNIHLELRLRDSRRVPFIWRSGSRLIPHHLRVFPFIRVTRARVLIFFSLYSLFNPTSGANTRKIRLIRE